MTDALALLGGELVEFAIRIADENVDMVVRTAEQSGYICLHVEESVSPGKSVVYFEMV